MAGKEVAPSGYGAWIRPISSRLTAEISEDERRYEDGSDPRVLDVIDIPLKVRANAQSHQTENYIIDTENQWAKRGTLAWSELPPLLDRPPSLWLNNDSNYHGENDRVKRDLATHLNSSLFLIEPADLSIRVHVPGADFGDRRRRARASFGYGGAKYSLIVTDPIAERAFFARPDGDYALNDTYLCISLAESHTDGYCYKLVAAVISKGRL